MTRKESSAKFLKTAANRLNLSIFDVKDYLKAMQKITYTMLKSDEFVIIPYLCEMRLIKANAISRVNPFQPTKKIEVPEHYKIKIKVCSELKKKVRTK